MGEGDARRLEDALRLQTGELLEGFYADWALAERERLRFLNLKSHVRLMFYKKHLGAFEDGLAWARRALVLDPLREEIHREVMRLYAANGQRSLAIEQYRTCCRVLDEELGIPPMEETQQLVSQILKGADVAPESSGTEAPFGEGVGRGLALGRALEEIHLAMRCAEKVHRELQLAIRHLEKLTPPHPVPASHRMPHGRE
jgi:tetratricopeptide (TPR) repeat protein